MVSEYQLRRWGFRKQRRAKGDHPDELWAITKKNGETILVSLVNIRFVAVYRLQDTGFHYFIEVCHTRQQLEHLLLGLGAPLQRCSFVGPVAARRQVASCP